MSRETFVLLWIATVSIWEGAIFAHHARAPRQQMASIWAISAYLGIVAALGFAVLLALAILPSATASYLLGMGGGTVILGVFFLGLGSFFLEAFLLCKVLVARFHDRQN